MISKNTQKVNTIIWSISLIVISLFCYLQGIKKGESKRYEPKYETLSDVSERYFKEFGNPSTSEEQRKFEYVIYNDIYEEDIK